MDAEHAVKQLEYVISPRLASDGAGHWESALYGDIVSDVAARGSNEDVHELIRHVRDRVDDGRRPSPASVRSYADGLLDQRGRPLADGGGPEA